MLNGLDKKQKSSSNRFDSEQNEEKNASSQAYLNECSKVVLDAYDREVKKLQSINDKEKYFDEEIQKGIEKEDKREEEKKLKLKAEILETAKVVARQMAEKNEKDKIAKNREKEEFNKTYGKIPPNIVSTFPRIADTPAEVRNQRKIAMQNIMKEQLESQIETDRLHKQSKHMRWMSEEHERLKKLEEETKREERENAEKIREKVKQYQDELRRDIECKEKRKSNDKRLEKMEYEGVTSLRGIADKNQNDKNIPYKEIEIPPAKEDLFPTANPIIEEEEDDEFKDNAAIIEGYFDKTDKEIPPKNEQKEICKKNKLEDDKMNKIASILEKKQKKTKELMLRIEELEKKASQRSNSVHEKPSVSGYSLNRLKNVLSRESFQIVSEGKKFRISGEDAKNAISSRQSVPKISVETRPKFEEKKTKSKDIKRLIPREEKDEKLDENRVMCSREKAQKIAYNRYISELEIQVCLLTYL